MPREAQPARQRLDSNDRESEIVAAATEVFAEKGFAATKIQDIAERVGVLKGSLYYYIDSKEDLLVRIFAAINRDAVEIVEVCRTLDGPPLERLHRYVERYVRWYLQNRVAVSLYFTEWHQLTGDLHADAVAQRATFEDFIRDLVNEAHATGDTSPDVDADLATTYILGAINAIGTWYRPGTPAPPDVVATTYADLTVRLITGPDISHAWA